MNSNFIHSYNFNVFILSPPMGLYYPTYNQSLPCVTNPSHWNPKMKGLSLWPPQHATVGEQITVHVLYLLIGQYLWIKIDFSSLFSTIIDHFPFIWRSRKANEVIQSNEDQRPEFANLSIKLEKVYIIFESFKKFCFYKNLLIHRTFNEIVICSRWKCV